MNDGFCSECKQLIPRFMWRRTVFGREVSTCSPKCGRDRKTRLQRERRQAAQVSQVKPAGRQ